MVLTTVCLVDEEMVLTTVCLVDKEMVLTTVCLVDKEMVLTTVCLVDKEMVLTTVSLIDKEMGLTTVSLIDTGRHREETLHYTGIACWLERRTRDRKFRVQIPAGAAGEFFLQSQLCVLTLTRCPFHPYVTAVARKRPRSFCRKCRWQITSEHTYTFDSTKVGVG